MGSGFGSVVSRSLFKGPPAMCPRGTKPGKARISQFVVLPKTQFSRIFFGWQIHTIFCKRSDVSMRAIENTDYIESMR